MQSNKQMIFIGKRMVGFCVTLRQTAWIEEVSPEKDFMIKKILELLLEWASDELVNRFAKNPATWNFRWHAFLKSKEEIPRNQSAEFVENPIIIAEKSKSLLAVTPSVILPFWNFRHVLGAVGLVIKFHQQS